MTRDLAGSQSSPCNETYRAVHASLGRPERCTKYGEEKPRPEFSRDRSRKDGRYPQCKACVMRWRQENAERLAEYNQRWREANRDKQRAWGRRYRERKRARRSEA
jgi:hypothetical protein